MITGNSDHKMKKIICASLFFLLSQACLAAQDSYTVVVAEIISSNFHSNIDNIASSTVIAVNINLKVKNLQIIGGGKVPKYFSGVTKASSETLGKGGKIVVRYRVRDGKLEYDKWGYPEEFFCFSTDLLDKVDSKLDVYLQETDSGGRDITCLSRNELFNIRKF